MKKFITGVVLLGMLSVPGLSYASTGSSMYLGQQYARVNINVRSAPVVGDNLIGHVDKGGSVQVVAVTGSWCKIQSKFPKAYVYCSNLQSDGNSAGSVLLNVQIHALDNNSPAVKALNDSNSWLYNDDNLGINYINGSYYSAAQKATSYWDKDAKLSDYYFGWPLPQKDKCLITFSSTAKANEVFASTCFDGAQEGVGAPEYMDKPLVGYELPKLPFKTFLADVLADQALMVKFNDYFNDSKAVAVLYRLYSLKGTLIWEAKVIDSNSGLFMVVTSDATKETSNLKVETGRFN